MILQIATQKIFYTYHLFKSNFNNVNIIEFKNLIAELKKSLFGFLRYLTTIPFYCEQVLNKKNKDIIKNKQFNMREPKSFIFLLCPTQYLEV